MKNNECTISFPARPPASVAAGLDRLAREPLRAYHAYCFYRDLGPGRTLNQAWLAYQRSGQASRDCAAGRQALPGPRRGSRGPTACPGSWTRFSQRYHWVQRVAFYDQHMSTGRQAGEWAIRWEQKRQLDQLLWDVEERNQDRLQFQIQRMKQLIEQVDHLPLTAVIFRKTEKVGTTVTRTYRKVGGRTPRASMALIQEFCEILRDAAYTVQARKKKKWRHLPAAHRRDPDGLPDGPTQIQVVLPQEGLVGPPDGFGWGPEEFPLASNLGPGPEQLPHESAADYAAFCVYRDLGPDRSLDAAWQAYRRNSSGAPQTRGRPRMGNPTTRCPGAWTVRSTRHHWRKRALAYDRAQVQQNQVDSENERLEALRQAAQQSLQRTRDDVQLLERCMEDILTMLRELERLPLQTLQHRRSVRVGRQKACTTTLVDVKGLPLSNFVAVHKRARSLMSAAFWRVGDQL